MTKIFSALILFFTLNAFAQKEANFWFFGENAGLDFTTNPPTDITGSLSTDEGSASISDANGILQFYTDGTTVFSRNGSVMSNGRNLLGDSSSAQSAIIVPKPLSTSIYYIFTVGNEMIGSGGNGVAYSEVDMSLNGGLGEVLITNKNTPLTGSELAREKITSVVATECNTFWVITSDRNTFLTYKVNQNGVNTSPSSTFNHNRNLNNLRGYLKLSPNGKTLVNANASAGAYLYDFNATDGSVSNERVLFVPGFSYGVEFSRDSKKLYVSTGTFSQLLPNGNRNIRELATLQYYSLDSDKDNIIDNINVINNSLQRVFETPDGYRGALQLAANGKIYYARSRDSFLGVINFPEKDFTNRSNNEIGFVYEGLDLNGKVSTEGLPPFIQSFFLPIEIKDSNTNKVLNDQNLQYCVGSDKILETEPVNGSNIRYNWIFDNGINTPIDITPVTNPESLTLNNLQTQNTGKYSLKITLTNSCGNATEYNGTFNIEVFEAASAKLNPDPIYFCDSDATIPNEFDFRKSELSAKSKEILEGLDDTIFEVLYFDDEDKAIDNLAGTNLPDNYEVNTPGSQIIYARVQNQKAPKTCYARTNFTLTVTGIPIATNPGPYRECDTDIAGLGLGYHDTFLLEDKDNDILGGTSGLDPALYNVSYHTTPAGAQKDNATDVILKNNPYRNSIINSQPIYVRLESKANTNCFDASMSFDLVVDPLPIPKENPTELKQCDTDPDKQTTFNLTLAEKNISENHLTDRFEYYKTEVDAIAGTPQVVDKTSYFVDTIGEAWVRIISKLTTCYTISKIDLTVSYAPNELYEETFKSCDDFLNDDGNSSAMNNDTDGITFFDLSSAPGKISLDPDIIVELYETEDDRTKSLNEIRERLDSLRSDLSKYRNKNIPNKTGNKFPIFYKLISESNNDCQGIGQFYLQIQSVPNFTVMGEENIKDPLIVCKNDTPLILKAEDPLATYVYQWTNQAGDLLGIDPTQKVFLAGKYTVTASDISPIGCSRERTIVVEESDIAILEQSFITIIDQVNNIGSEDKLSISIDTISNDLGPGDYQFAIINMDDNTRTPFAGFQDEPLFENLEGGIYKILVNDKNGCSPDRPPLIVSVIQFPKFFTPNGDGDNDNWVVKGANKTFYPNSSINIFNRYGKLVAQIPIDGQGWDGTYGGKILSSDDYWYNITLIPADTTKPTISKKGNFSLIR